MTAGRNGSGPELRVRVGGGATTVACEGPDVLATILAAGIAEGGVGLLAAATAAADVFPLEPTVVHAPPTAGTTGLSWEVAS